MPSTLVCLLVFLPLIGPSRNKSINIFLPLFLIFLECFIRKFKYLYFILLLLFPVKMKSEFCRPYFTSPHKTLSTKSSRHRSTYAELKILEDYTMQKAHKIGYVRGS